ncbi:hypothetical protein F4778DRAFT_786800 [Xylariomycetidae sp. FL2044]|nr:hypothetical protein F4778DRAFT_786800 [Xylariomycetidae sp. FL2044]
MALRTTSTTAAATRTITRHLLSSSTSSSHRSSSSSQTLLIQRKPLLLAATTRTPPPPLTYRFSSSSSSSSSSSPFQIDPAPPRLPADQQAEFERLQRTANTQEGFNASSTPTFSEDSSTHTAVHTPDGGEKLIEATPAADGGNAALSTPLRKGAPPEFEGDTNPKTGEVGGPKNEPLRWGAEGDYSFNGRVTDF